MLVVAGEVEKRVGDWLPGLASLVELATLRVELEVWKGSVRGLQEEDQ